MAEYQRDLFDFVLETLIEEGNTEEESLLMMSTINENWFQGIQNATKMFRIMTGIDKVPVKPPSGPVNLTSIFKGASPPPTPKPARFQIGTPQPKPAAPTARGGGSPISAVVQALTNLQGSTPQSGPAAERAKAERETAIQAKWGKAMNQTPSKFGKAGPDVVVPKPAGPDQGVGTKPRVAEPYTPPRPAAKVEPKVTIPKADNPRRDPFAPVVRPRSVTTERPKPSGPITSAQAIAMGSKEGQPSKSSVSTYRDAVDKKGTSVGRYLTLAQHRQAVADRKAAESKSSK